MFGTGATAAGNGFAVLDVSDFQQRRANPVYRVVSFSHLGRREHRRAECAADQDRRKAIHRHGRRGRRWSRRLRLREVGQRVPPPDRHLGSDAPDRRGEDPARGRRPGQLRGHLHRAHHLDPAGRRRRAARARLLRPLLPLLPGGRRGRRADHGLQLLRLGPAVLGHPRHHQHQGDGLLQASGAGAKALPGSQYANSNTPPTFVRMYDWATSKPSFPKDRGADAGDIWTTSQDNGFQVISLYSKVTVTPSSIIGGHEQVDDPRRDRRRRGKDRRRELVGAADDRRHGDERRSLHRDHRRGPTRSSPPASSTRPRAPRRRSLLQTEAAAARPPAHSPGCSRSWLCSAGCSGGGGRHPLRDVQSARGRLAMRRRPRVTSLC